MLLTRPCGVGRPPRTTSCQTDAGSPRGSVSMGMAWAAFPVSAPSAVARPRYARSAATVPAPASFGAADGPLYARRMNSRRNWLRSGVVGSRSPATRREHHRVAGPLQAIRANPFPARDWPRKRNRPDQGDPQGRNQSGAQHVSPSGAGRCRQGWGCPPCAGYSAPGSEKSKRRGLGRSGPRGHCAAP